MNMPLREWCNRGAKLRITKLFNLNGLFDTRYEIITKEFNPYLWDFALPATTQFPIVAIFSKSILEYIIINNLRWRY
jgi:hypothetical protein